MVLDHRLGANKFIPALQLPIGAILPNLCKVMFAIRLKCHCHYLWNRIAEAPMRIIIFEVRRLWVLGYCAPNI